MASSASNGELAGEVVQPVVVEFGRPQLQGGRPTRDRRLGEVQVGAVAEPGRRDHVEP